MTKNIIALAGSSGAGKTTLGKALAEKYGLKFIEQSAGQIISDEDAENLRKKYGYQNLGQVNVLKMSANNPDFAYDFQRAILEARMKIINGNDNIIIDRSPLDCVVFLLNQVVHQISNAQAENFIHTAFESANTIRAIIHTEYCNPGLVEDDGSRVDKIYFQRKIDMLFSGVMELYAGTLNHDQLEDRYLWEINDWDWNNRLDDCAELLEKEMGYRPLLTNADIPLERFKN